MSLHLANIFFSFFVFGIHVVGVFLMLVASGVTSLQLDAHDTIVTNERSVGVQFEPTARRKQPTPSGHAKNQNYPFLSIADLPSSERVRARRLRAVVNYTKLVV